MLVGSLPAPSRLKWKIFYGDGATFTDQDGAAESAPKTNVQLIAIEDREHGRVICKADDFYIYDVFDGELNWQGVDYFGMWDYLSRPGAKVVLFGRTLGNVEYRNVVQRAFEDGYLPPKTAWHVGERKPE